MNAPHYIISNDLNITLILDGQTHSIGDSHQNHGDILEAIREKNWEVLPDLVDVSVAIETFCSGEVTVNEFGEVVYGGQVLHNVITERMMVLREQGFDYARLGLFLENLLQNPSKRSVDHVYTFIENEGMPITEDGCFVGYKSIRDDYTDCHSGKFDNRPGQEHEMPRNMVDDNPDRACSHGFHVGSQQYASGFGPHDSRMVLVKVNPRDVVCIPHDGVEKLRVHRYTVLEEIERNVVLQSPVYNQEETVFDEDPELDDQWNDFPDDDSYLDEIDEEDYEF